MRIFRFLAMLLCGIALLPNAASADESAPGVRVVVIDAGHGGPNFPGAVYRGVKEKDLNLAVALKLGAIIEEELPQVKVVYTRKTDKQFSKSLNADLQARADIANNAGGDLFVSIHANASASPSAYGAESLLMGDTPLEQHVNDEVLYANNKEEFMDMSDQRTAAIVRAYLENLKFTYGQYSEAMARLLQKSYAAAGRHVRKVKHKPLKVLYATNMPGILTEIGFMTNSKEMTYMCSEKGQDEIARSIFCAVRDYLELLRRVASDDGTGSASVSKPEPAAGPAGGEVRIEPAEEPEAAPKAESEPKAAVRKGYTIQVLASTKKLKPGDWQFRSYKNKVLEMRSSGRYRYKYCVGRYATKAAAQKELPKVKRTFSDAYVVAYEDDRIR